MDMAVEVTNLQVSYGEKKVIKDLSIKIVKNNITAIIGPSGCGKTTFLKVFNRLLDLIPEASVLGEVKVLGEEIYNHNTDLVKLRKQVGMVFQKPNPFPMSVFDNVAYGPRIHGIKDRSLLRDIVDTSLKQAALWNEVRDNLGKSALKLSGGQQQRLCIARVLAVGSEIILMDEPCSSLDPSATAKIEDLMQELKDNYTIIIVTHNMQQAARVSDFTAFLLNGDLIEYGPTVDLFTRPKDKRTNDYVTGKFG
ncbi:MAG: Phosphate import ATP-binding protein PstB 3 [candidate division WS2 bacterium]|nr:Phosphate import ATP-binding protein PstB 3 [Candidatus Lithacetigena glycinireducens]MBT9175514.1 Phosphate import ATP-binding protein PstB 3 [Candidatus Lithacetigena glycinireducens]